eukprot:TRINITY_DN21433_c0_g1_i1.p1 TRINITY_DN21433_c0_g1~~TRINITY_DN21433_c0_g1_i1.p1  ORF type:complete len:247 (+),score=39.72 TRINITY_DN21433_c0_g1_i1:313-1053(+)
MTAFTRMKATPYLQKHIAPVVRDVLQHAHCFEVDPTKLAQGQTMESNFESLLTACRKFIEAVVAHVDDWPYPLRMIVRHLQQGVAVRFPGAKSKHIVVGGYIFLRFLCPAIINSASWCNVDPPTPTGNRALLLITKVLQGLANGQEFGNKEAFMKPANEFINTHMSQTDKFFNDLGQIDLNQIYDPPLSTQEETMSDLQEIHCLINKNLSKVVKSLSLYRRKDEISKLAVVLLELGDPNTLYGSKP